MVRRLLLPALLGLQATVAALALAVAVAGVLALPFERRARPVRLAASAWVYVGVEWVALVALLGIWLQAPLRTQQWADDANIRVLRWALGRVLAAGTRTLGFRMEVADPPDRRPLSEPAPVLVLARHAGVGDSVAIVWLLIDRYRRCPRVVLKDALRWDPLADVVLGRLGACFVPPPARRRQAPEGQIAATAADLRPGDALLLFPEGTNWTPDRRRRLIRRLWSAHRPRQALTAELLTHVLPPRRGGLLACLQAAPALPVVVFAHAGLDGAVPVRRLWHALPFRSALRVRWWRSAPPPTAEEDRVRWLDREWAVVDEWIAMTTRANR